MSDTRISDWLSAVVPNPSTKAKVEQQSVKRRQLTQDDCNNKYFPTPPDSAYHNSLISASPSKRPRDTYTEPDITPRPPRSINLEGSIYSALLNTLSSKASKISRTSSPTKQILYAKLHQTGFRQASFTTDKAPASLIALCQELK